MADDPRSADGALPDRERVTQAAAGTSLAAFLQARRARLAPTELGLLSLGERRVPGLRREELAQRASISLPYLVRLEQGRDRHPSPQVVAALAEALCLNSDETRFLRQLATERGPSAGQGPVRGVSQSTRDILDSLGDHPALVLTPCRDILAATPLATAVCPGFIAGENVLRYVFLDPGARDVYVNWSEVAAEAVRTLHTAAAPAWDEERNRLVAFLSSRSPEFVELWSRFDVREKTIGVKRFRHPELGEIALSYSTMTINESDGQILSVYRADPGSPAEGALRTLLGGQRRRPSAIAPT